MRLTGFEGRCALVTGGAGGIGQVMVKLLREAGAQVMATDTRAAVEGLAPAEDDGLLWRPQVIALNSGSAALAILACAGRYPAEVEARSLVFRALAGMPLVG